MPRLFNRRFLLGIVLALGVLIVAYVLILPGISSGPPGAEDLWPDTEAWATEQLLSMTLEEKVSQLFSVRAYGRMMDPDDAAYQDLVDMVEQFGLGGVTFFQGNPSDQIALINDLQGRAKLPLLIAQDMEWGAGMRVDETTVFPRAMAMGATRDVEWARHGRVYHRPGGADSRGTAHPRSRSRREQQSR